MSRIPKWRAIDASELIDPIDETTVPKSIPACPAIYLWRRRYAPPDDAKTSAEACMAWIHEVTSQPAARIGRKPLSHCVWTDGIQIGGGGLTSNKEQLLQRMSAKRATRESVLNYIETLSAFALPIYIGESDNLRKRVKQHLDGHTGLGDYLEQYLGIAWRDVTLHYCVLSSSPEMSEAAKSLQEMFELLAQRILVPFATERPG